MVDTSISNRRALCLCLHPVWLSPSSQCLLLMEVFIQASEIGHQSAICRDRWSDAAAQVTWQHFKHSICILFLKTQRFTRYSFRASFFFIYCLFFVFLFCLIIDSGGKYLHRFQRSPLTQLLLSLSLKWTEGCINGSKSTFGFLFNYFFSKENSTIISRFLYQFFDRNFVFSKPAWLRCILIFHSLLLFFLLWG